jgi:hypothetical protein
LKENWKNDPIVSQNISMGSDAATYSKKESLLSVFIRKSVINFMFPDTKGSLSGKLKVLSCSAIPLCSHINSIVP